MIYKETPEYNTIPGFHLNFKNSFTFLSFIMQCIVQMNDNNFKFYH